MNISSTRARPFIWLRSGMLGNIKPIGPCNKELKGPKRQGVRCRERRKGGGGRTSARRGGRRKRKGWVLYCTTRRLGGPDGSQGSSVVVFLYHTTCGVRTLVLGATMWVLIKAPMHQRPEGRTPTGDRIRSVSDGSRMVRQL